MRSDQEADPAPPGAESPESRAVGQDDHDMADDETGPQLEPLMTTTAEDRKRLLIIALFCVGSVVLAIALAFVYSMPSAD